MCNIQHVKMKWEKHVNIHLKIGNTSNGKITPLCSSKNRIVVRPKTIQNNNTWTFFKKIYFNWIIWLLLVVLWTINSVMDKWCSHFVNVFFREKISLTIDMHNCCKKNNWWSPHFPVVSPMCHIGIICRCDQIIYQYANCFHLLFLCSMKSIFQQVSILAAPQRILDAHLSDQRLGIK